MNSILRDTSTTHVKQRRLPVVIALITGLIVSGCEIRNPHDHGGAMVVEYRPEWKPQERKAPYTAVYVLWGWRLLRPPTTGPASTQPVVVQATHYSDQHLPWELAFEVKEVALDKGNPLGFRRRNGQLIGVAGPTTLPLANGHYCWHMLPGNPSAESDLARDRFNNGVNAVLITIFTLGVVALLGWLTYEDEKACEKDQKHHHDHQDCDDQ